MRMARGSVGVATVVAVLVCGGPVWAQTPPTQPPAQSGTQTPPPAAGIQVPSIPPDQLARIREGLARESTLKLEDGRRMIYVEVIGKWPTFAEIAKGYDLMNGPTGGGNPMSHQEYLNMVTPKELYGSGGISAPEVLTMALVNYFGQKYISKGLKEISQTRDQKKIEEIRARIDAELAALRKGGL